MKKIISLIAVLILTVSVFSLSACGDNKPADSDSTTTAAQEKKSELSKPAEIAELPKTEEEQLELLNSVIEYFDVYCRRYTKEVKCTVSNLSVGALSSASNSYDAFKSIFGEKDLTVDYDYDSAPESFSANIISSVFEKKDLSEISVKQEGQNILLTAKFPNESNPDSENGQLRKLSSNFVGAETVKKSLGEFSSSAGSVSVSASDIVLTATVNSIDSSLQKLTVSYDEHFALGTVKLVQLDGSSVTGTSHTAETYSGMK